MGTFKKQELIDFFSRPRTLDGGFTTELERDGYDFTNRPLWGAEILLTEPEAIIPVHKRFLNAGARILETTTFKYAIELVQQQGVPDKNEVRRIGQNAVKLARLAIEQWREETSQDHRTDMVVLAGSVGPYSELVDEEVRILGFGRDYTCYGGRYVDDVPAHKITDYLYGQAELVHSGGADIIAFDSIPSIAEAKCVLEALDRLPDALAWISFTCQDGSRTSYGDSFSSGVSLCLSHPRVLAVGVNCSNPAFVTPLLKSAASNAQKHNKPFIVYPNSGEMYNHVEGWSGEDNRANVSWAERVHDWLEHGATVIGGCCRVYVEDIQQIAEAIEKERATFE